ncbi:MAG TPA: hypothetical protein VI078_16495 [bacterium]
MAEHDRPLPNPPRSRFGRQIPGQEQGGADLTADRLAQAAAEGRLDEVLQHEIPEGEHARTLAMMMLGMSGMMPPGAAGPAGMPGVEGMAALAGTAGAPADGPPEVPGFLDAPGADATGAPAAALPPEVLAATMQADIAGLMSLLRAEHERRGGVCAPPSETSAPVPPVASADEGAPVLTAPSAADRAQPGIDQALIDELIRVAADNQVTVDWLLLRAVKLYVEEYRRTGRL